MKVLTCARARRRLQAFHDEELSISDQIAVDQHLEWCDGCASALADLRTLRQALRGAAPGRASESLEPSFPAALIARMKAEEKFSLVGRIQTLFEDMHLMYVSAGAVVATCVCVAIVTGMMRFATTVRPDSLAAMMNLLSPPGSNQNPVLLDPTVLMPRALDESIFTSSPGDDAMYALSAVVTREGRIENLEVFHALRGTPVGDDSKRMESLLDSVGRARFEPGRVAGAPVAVNMVWLVAQTTVRGSIKTFDQPTIRAGRKRTAAVQPEPVAVA